MRPIFHWDNAFLTGIGPVDEQHRTLVALINELAGQTVDVKTADPALFDACYQRLLNYCREHFQDEASLMQTAGLVDEYRQQHLQEHRQFVAEVAELKRQADQDHGRIRLLLDYLVSWLAYHILGADQSMSRQVAAIRQGISFAQAYQLEQQREQQDVGPLLSAMKNLFQLVSERNHELWQLNQQLEEQVQTRTRGLEEANKRLRVLSVRDDLTGLFNRRHAIHTLSSLCAAMDDSLSILLLDADQFKSVNDHFGHLVGDKLLQSLATYLQDSVRTDDIVCRLGGDEFLIICPRTDVTGANVLAEKICHNAPPFYTAEGQLCWAGKVSIGVAVTAAQVRETPEQLLNRADQALYAMKQQVQCPLSAGEYVGAGMDGAAN